ncbi:MAG: hypothetical protein FWC33_07345 [Candidatus Bathyarchaeota archaeon]|nr:hypothetical protein [Candidatus Termiticorpusculum sp.]
MSDLANSCEYLSIDNTCAIISKDPKAKAFRQLKCENSQNVASCCYLCLFRSQCATSCKYLGQYGNHFEPQTMTDNMSPDAVQESKDGASQFENVLVVFCFSCKTEMIYAKTQFTVDNWKGKSPLMFSDKVLSVTVFLCPQCGKIEFKADVLREGVM